MTKPDVNESHTRPQEKSDARSPNKALLSEVANITREESRNIPNYSKTGNTEKFLARADEVLPAGKSSAHTDDPLPTKKSSSSAEGLPATKVSPHADKALPAEKVSTRTNEALPAQTLASPKEIFSLKNAREIKEGQEVPLNPGERLAPGDHVLRFPFKTKDGKTDYREAQIHMPPVDPLTPNKPIPVVVNLHGAFPGTMSPLTFRNALALDQLTDQKGAATVYPLAQSRILEENGKKPAYTWNIRGGLRSDDNRQKQTADVGHDDADFIAYLSTEVIPGVTNPGMPPNYNDWGLVAHSQGAAAANQLLGDERLANVYPKVALISGTRETGQNTPVAEGNAKKLLVVVPGKDIVLPSEGQNQTGLQLFKAFSKVADLTGLGALNPARGSPQELLNFHIGRLGESVWERFTAADPSKSPMVLADYNKLDQTKEPFNPKIIDKVDSLHVFKSQNGTLKILYQADGLHPVNGFPKLNVKQTISDFMFGG